jgi:hypothetical protein
VNGHSRFGPVDVYATARAGFVAEVAERRHIDPRVEEAVDDAGFVVTEPFQLGRKPGRGSRRIVKQHDRLMQTSSPQRSSHRG